MMMLLHLSIIIISLVSSTEATSNCADGYNFCSPPGGTSTTTPQIGTPEFQNLFMNIVQSSLPKNERSDLEVKSELAASQASLCCNTLLSCLLMSNITIPFCYDKFTTNYFLPDGSYGTIVDGAYNSHNGDIANLVTGEYTLVDGRKGNIYRSDENKPDTATLLIPSQFTGTGMGSAIPASSLGKEITVTYSTTIPGTTRAKTTIEVQTTVSVVDVTILLPTLVSGSIIAATLISFSTVPVTIQATTVSGTTVTGKETTVTTTRDAASLAPATTEKSQAWALVGGKWLLVMPAMLLLQ